MPAPDMAFDADTGIVNEGRMDSWNTARDPGFGMAYFNRSDLPYYYALADAFTIGDQYFQSTFTATNPNRLHLFSGSNGLSVPDSGFCAMSDTEYNPGFTWETMAETLQKANVTWQVIQELDNFDDNGTVWCWCSALGRVVWTKRDGDHDLAVLCLRDRLRVVQVVSGRATGGSVV